MAIVTSDLTRSFGDEVALDGLSLEVAAGEVLVLLGPVILWLSPAVAALGLGVIVRVSARVRTAQEANQLGGAVVLPVVVLTVGQSTGLLLVDAALGLALGGVVWAAAVWLIARGARRFTRDALATRV